MSWSVKFNTGNLQVIDERRGSSTVVSYEYCHKNMQLSVHEQAILLNDLYIHDFRLLLLKCI
jgi:hypothetical protein